MTGTEEGPAECRDSSEQNLPLLIFNNILKILILIFSHVATLLQEAEFVQLYSSHSFKQTSHRGFSLFFNIGGNQAVHTGHSQRLQTTDI